MSSSVPFRHQNPPDSSTSAHPPENLPNPSLSADNGAAQRRFAASSASRAAELSSLTLSLRGALRQFPDFPSPGILFEDIMPIFANPLLHEALVRALELHVLESYHHKPDVIVGLEARGFLFGPSLALRLGAGFVPVRKKGKLPGPTETASYKKEYGEDFFQMQKFSGVQPGTKVLIVDDIIATGMFPVYFYLLSWTFISLESPFH
jgi:adenine phosphoribosyltransferase